MGALIVGLTLLAICALPTLGIMGGFWTGYYRIGWYAGLNGEQCYALYKTYPDFLERAEIRGYRAALKAKESARKD